MKAEQRKPFDKLLSNLELTIPSKKVLCRYVKNLNIVLLDQCILKMGSSDQERAVTLELTFAVLHFNKKYQSKSFDANKTS